MRARSEHVPIENLANRFWEVIDRVERGHGRVVITKDGRPAVAILSIEELEGLEETLEILSNRPLMRRLRKSQIEADAAQVEELTKDAALALVAAAADGQPVTGVPKRSHTSPTSMPASRPLRRSGER